MNRKAGLLLAGVLATIMVAVGYMAASMGGYKDVSDLARVEKPTLVTVKGTIADYRAEPGSDSLVFILQGEDGSLVTAEFSYQRFVNMHGRAPGPWILGQEIVVKGVFYPSRQGNTLGYMDIGEMLKGCHESYEAPQATS